MLQTAKPSTLANCGAQPSTSAPGLDYISLEAVQGFYRILADRIIVVDGKLNRIDETLRSGVEVPDATVADSLHNEVINKLRSQYLDYSRREAEFSAKYGATCGH